MTRVSNDHNYFGMLLGSGINYMNHTQVTGTVTGSWIGIYPQPTQSEPDPRMLPETFDLLGWPTMKPTEKSGQCPCLDATVLHSESSSEPSDDMGPKFSFCLSKYDLGFCLLQSRVLTNAWISCKASSIDNKGL